MEKHRKYRHILGYLVGFLIFLIIIPGLIYGISRIEHDFFSIPLIKQDVFRIPIAILLFLSGLFFAIWSNIDLFRVGEGGPTDVFNIEISPRSKKLVVTGPYRYTRNPMVFGMNSVYFSMSLFVNSLASFIFVTSFFIIVMLYLKLTEEKRLWKDFGDEYRDYQKRVPMIIPFLRRKK